MMLTADWISRSLRADQWPPTFCFYESLSKVPLVFAFELTY